MLRRKKPLRPKAKRKSLSWYKNKCWSIFSQFIRLRHADENGMAQCVTCRKTDHWKNLQAGHYVRAGAGLGTYFEETNVHVQCYRCNIHLKGNMDQYALFMMNKYGAAKLEELNVMREKGKKYYVFDYLEMISHYQAMVESLTKAA